MSGPVDFHEALDRASDPLDGRHADFDWDALAADLGEQDLAEGEFAKLADGLRVILQWLVPARLNPATYQQAITRKCIALVWCLSPAHFDNSPSLKRLGAELGVHDVLLSRHAAGFRRTFGVSNRSQQHGWNFAKGEPPNAP